MILRYAGGETGARAMARRGAAVVVVDAFRASTTIAVLVSKGARVVPVNSITEAADHEADFRIGERGSAKVSGFDFGNSPTELLEAEIPAGSNVVLSTTNGTRVVEAAAGSPRIMTGAFVNAEAVAGALVSERLEEVAIVGCGWEGHRSSEDETAAGAILCSLIREGGEPDERARRVVDRYLNTPWKTRLRRNSAARRLERLGYEKDLGLCLSENVLTVAPRLLRGAFVSG